MNLEDTLSDRGSVYGDYELGCEFRAKVMGLISEYRDKNCLLPLLQVDEVHIFDIVNKLSRLVTSPDHIDTWHDIAGYATLTERVYLDRYSVQATEPISKGVKNGKR